MSVKYVECMGGALDGFKLMASTSIYPGYTTTIRADNDRYYMYRYDGEHMRYVDDSCSYCGKLGESVTYRFEGGDMDGRVLHNTHLCGKTIKIPRGTSCSNMVYRVDGTRLIFVGLE